MYISILCIIYFIQVKLNINHIHINYVQIFDYYLIIHGIKLIHKLLYFKNKCNLLTSNISQYNPINWKWTLSYLT